MLFNNIEIKELDSYYYANGLIHALETKFLKEADYLELIDSDDIKSAFFEKIKNLSNIKELNEDFFNLYLLEAKNLIESLTENKHFLAFLLLKYDLLNLKILLKQKLVLKNDLNTANSLNLNPLGFYTPQKLFDFVYNNETEDIYQEIINLIELIESEEKDLSAKKIDLIIDREFFNIARKLVNKFGSIFLLNLINFNAFLINIKNYLRIKTNINDIDEFRKNFLNQKYVDLKFFEENWEIDPSNLVDKFIKFEFYFDLKKAFGEYLKDKDTGVLEKSFDNIISTILIENLKDKNGAIELLYSYFYFKEIEMKNLKIVYVGKLNKVEREKIIKLLRKSYV